MSLAQIEDFLREIPEEKKDSFNRAFAEDYLIRKGKKPQDSPEEEQGVPE